MREWSDQRGVPHSYIGICSDTRAGSTSEDASIQELKIPVTTDPLSEISHTLQNLDTGKMTVVFCTYQSLPLIEEAQNNGAPQFDIILCDEAHRTTGVDRPGDRTSPFVLVHDADRIRANKRLYMTATPKLFTESAKDDKQQNIMLMCSLWTTKTNTDRNFIGYPSLKPLKSANSLTTESPYLAYLNMKSIRHWQAIPADTVAKST